MKLEKFDMGDGAICASVASWKRNRIYWWLFRRCRRIYARLINDFVKIASDNTRPKLQTFEEYDRLGRGVYLALIEYRNDRELDLCVLGATSMIDAVDRLYEWEYENDFDRLSSGDTWINRMDWVSDARSSTMFRQLKRAMGYAIWRFSDKRRIKSGDAVVYFDGKRVHGPARI